MHQTYAPCIPSLKYCLRHETYLAFTQICPSLTSQKILQNVSKTLGMYVINRLDVKSKNN